MAATANYSSGYTRAVQYPYGMAAATPTFKVYQDDYTMVGDEGATATVTFMPIEAGWKIHHIGFETSAGLGSAGVLDLGYVGAATAYIENASVTGAAAYGMMAATIGTVGKVSSDAIGTLTATRTIIATFASLADPVAGAKIRVFALLSKSPEGV